MVFSERSERCFCFQRTQDAPRHSSSELGSALGFHCFSSDDGFSCEATRDDGRDGDGSLLTGTGYASSTIELGERRNSREGFFLVFVSTTKKIQHYV